MKRMLLLFAMTLTTIAGAGIATAETATADAPFRFELAQTDSHRGLGVEGYVYNGLPWRISNVRLRVESVDANGAVTASASGWVIGDVKAGGSRVFLRPRLVASDDVSRDRSVVRQGHGRGAPGPGAMSANREGEV
jgi:hypothetical protein